MISDATPAFDLDVSRRRLLVAAGFGSGLLMASSLTCAEPAKAAANLGEAAEPTDTPPVAGSHLQFGADAAAEVTVSWHTLEHVRNPRVLLGQLDGKLEQTVEATPTSYTDAKSGQVVWAYHAKLAALRADAIYLYCVLHDGAAPEFGTSGLAFMKPATGLERSGAVFVSPSSDAADKPSAPSSHPHPVEPI